MAMKTSKVEVWAGSIADQPGGLDRVLAALADAGANLECVIARRQEGWSGQGVAFVTPIRGKKVQDAARAAGLSKADDIATLRIEGPDQPGLGHRITQAIADAGVNMRGLSAMVLGNKFVAYVGFDNDGDARAAARVISKAGAAPARTARKTAGRRSAARTRRTTRARR